MRVNKKKIFQFLMKKETKIKSRKIKLVTIIIKIIIIFLEKFTEKIKQKISENLK